MEFIEWAAQLNQNANLQTASLSVNSILVICYALLSIKIKDSRFLVAFFVCEIWANLIWINTWGEVVFWSGYVFVYLHLYWLIQKYKFKTIVFCIIMISFDIGMMVDAKVNTGTESFLYANYVNIVVFIHFCVICSFIDLERIMRNVRCYINSLLGVNSHGYNLPFFLLQFNFKTINQRV